MAGCGCRPSAIFCSHQDKYGILPTCTATPGFAGGSGTIMSCAFMTFQFIIVNGMFSAAAACVLCLGCAALPAGCYEKTLSISSADCHTLAGGMSNIALTFGVNHPCGRRPQRVVNAMKQHVADRAAKYPACFVPIVPAPPPAPVKVPNGKWSTPIIVPDVLPFNSSVFSTYWTTGAPERNCDDKARSRPVYVFRCGTQPVALAAWPPESLTNIVHSLQPC